MQWAVRYFLHQSHTWHDRAMAAAGTVAGCHPGLIAFAHLHRSIWDHRARIADTRFREINSDYVSPLS